METMLGTIEVGKLPWMALMFAAAYWKTAVAAVWGLGFTYILAKRMKAWYRDDARDGSVGMKDEEQIFINMKTIAKQRRPERTKEILTKGLFWLPLMAYHGGKKMATIIFYPILAYLDKAQTEGLAEGQRKVKTPVASLPASKAVSPPPGILIEGENAIQCRCGRLVGNMEEHSCPSVVVKGGNAIPSPSMVECDRCEKMVPQDAPHKCSSRVGPDGMVHCECGVSYKEEADFDHVCIEESVGIEKPQCSDCGRSYDPTIEVHAATNCRGCSDVHCKRYDCGQRVGV